MRGLNIILLTLLCGLAAACSKSPMQKSLNPKPGSEGGILNAKQLDCSSISTSCFYRAIQDLQSCLPANAHGQFSVGHTWCKISPTVQIGFDRAIGSGGWDFQVGIGPHPCARFESDPSTMKITFGNSVTTFKYSLDNHSLTMYCPDGSTWSASFASLSSCTDEIPRVISTNEWDQVSFAVGAATAPPLFECQD